MIGIRKREMPKKGQMSEQDAADEEIREAATFYNVVLYVPQHNSRVHYSSTVLLEAVDFAETCYTQEMDALPRSAMVYACTEEGRFALMGTTNRSQNTFKPVKVKIY